MVQSLFQSQLDFKKSKTEEKTVTESIQSSGKATKEKISTVAASLIGQVDFIKKRLLGEDSSFESKNLTLKTSNNVGEQQRKSKKAKHTEKHSGRAEKSVNENTGDVHMTYRQNVTRDKGLQVQEGDVGSQELISRLQMLSHSLISQKHKNNKNMSSPNRLIKTFENYSSNESRNKNTQLYDSPSTISSKNQNKARIDHLKLSSEKKMKNKIDQIFKKDSLMPNNISQVQNQKASFGGVKAFLEKTKSKKVF